MTVPDILLVSAPLDFQTREYSVVDNLGLMSLRASLERSGFTCDIVDSYREDWTYDEFFELIRASRPAIYIGFSIGSANFVPTIQTIQKLKQCDPNIHITLGGIWASHKHRLLLHRFQAIDSIVVGEGEETAVFLAEALSANRDWTGIPGLASRGKKGGIRLGWRNESVDIDSLPLPDRAPYVERIRQKKVQSIEFSRGCSGKCRFCNYSDYLRLAGTKRRRSRNPVRVVHEMEKVLGQTGINKFAFVDVDFIGFSWEERQRCRLFAQEVMKRELEIEFGIETQGKNIDYELLKTMKDAGLVHINLGIESWADSQLRRYGKASTRQDNLEAVAILDELNIPFLGYLIPIDPYVTREEIITTLEETERIGIQSVLDVDFCKKMSLHPESHFYERCRQDGLLGDYDPEDLTIHSIPYTQKNRDIREIDKAAEAINENYLAIRNRLERTAGEKDLPTLWNAFSSDILTLLKKESFVWFKDRVENTDDFSGEEALSEKLCSIDEEIAQVCSDVSKEKLENFQNFSVRIIGQEVSTRHKEVYSLPIKRN